MLYTIGEIAKKLNMAPSTLRYYDKEGLLPFLERTRGGIRMFKEEDVSALEIIECLKKTGMSIAEIKKFMDYCAEGDATIDKRLELINCRYEAVKLMLKQMEADLHMLEYKKWYYEEAKKAGTCSIHNNMSLEMVPAEFHDIVKGKNK